MYQSVNQFTAAPRAALRCLALRAAICVAASLLAASHASASPTYLDVDSHFSPQQHFINGPDTTLWTYNVTVTSDHDYTNVGLVFPFAYQIDALPPNTTSQTIFPWNNTTHHWENGGDSIAIYGVNSQNLLVPMSDTDIPLTDSQPPLGPASTVFATDSVPIIMVGDFTAGVPRSFSFNVQTAPTAVHHEISGFFVTQTPEPGSFVLLSCGLAGVLLFIARRRRAARLSAAAR